MSDYIPPACLAEFPVVISLPVLWGDQDAFGHVNNTQSIRWFESSRIAYFERTGLDAALEPLGLGPILASITCHFRHQIRYPDTVHIGGRVIRLGRASFEMEHAIFSEQADAIASDGRGIVVVFDYQANRSQPIPEDVRNLIAQVEGRTREDLQSGMG